MDVHNCIGIERVGLLIRAGNVLQPVQSAGSEGFEQPLLHELHRLFTGLFQIVGHFGPQIGDKPSRVLKLIANQRHTVAEDLPVDRTFQQVKEGIPAFHSGKQIGAQIDAVECLTEIRNRSQQRRVREIVQVHRGGEISCGRVQLLCQIRLQHRQIDFELTVDDRRIEGDPPVQTESLSKTTGVWDVDSVSGAAVQFESIVINTRYAEPTVCRGNPLDAGDLHAGDLDNVAGAQAVFCSRNLDGLIYVGYILDWPNTLCQTLHHRCRSTHGDVDRFTHCGDRNIARSQSDYAVTIAGGHCIGHVVDNQRGVSGPAGPRLPLRQRENAFAIHDGYAGIGGDFRGRLCSGLLFQSDDAISNGHTHRT